MTENEVDALLDVRRAAELVGRHPETVRRWVWSGRLPAVREGRRLLVAREDVEALASPNGRTPLTLGEWAERARAAQGESAVSGPPVSSADLILDDRRERSEAGGRRAGG